MSEIEYVYQVAQVATFFEISEQTVRDWASDFAEYLSEEANPGRRKTRLFTGKDMAVLALVAGMKALGKQSDDIHVALKNGERGDTPPPPDAIDSALTTRQKFAIQIQVLRGEIEKLTRERDTAIQKADTLIEENQTLKIQLARLEEQLKSAETMGKLEGELVALRRLLDEKKLD